MSENQEPKRKKVNKMTSAEIDEALKKTEEHMKGLTSRYAKALLEQKAVLASK